MFKKILSTILAIAIVAASFAVSAQTPTPVSQPLVTDFTHENAPKPKKDGDFVIKGKTLISYTGSATTANVPEGVTVIGSTAFAHNSTIKTVRLPNGITTIDEQAFANCYSLEHVSIPKTLTSIGDSAFYSCSLLKSITLPKGLKTVGEFAFSSCMALQKISIPETVTSFADTFENCIALKSISVSPKNKVYASENSVLYNKAKTTLLKFPLAKVGKSFTVPKTVTKIDDNAFNGTQLHSVSLPEGLLEIGQFAFTGARLTSIVFPKGLLCIGDGAFNCNFDLADITMPQAPTFIGGYAFDNTPWLNSQPEGMVYIGTIAYVYKGTSWDTAEKEVVLKPETTAISGNAFYSCQFLYSITIPQNVRSIGNYAFQYCGNLKNIVLENKNVHIGMNVFDYTKWFTDLPDGIFYMGKIACGYKSDDLIPKNSKLALRSGTTAIADGAFAYQEGLVSMTIPNTVKSIGANAFDSCSGLQKLTVPKSVTAIGKDAFVNSKNLILYGTKNSAVQKYAKKYAIPFRISK